MKQSFFLRNNQVKQNAIDFIRSLDPRDHNPNVIVIRDYSRSLEQNSRLHAMLGEVSKKARYQDKKRTIDFWKGLFVSGWEIATGRKTEIVYGLEGELINIRQSTTTLNVSEMTELMDYIEAYCAMNEIALSSGEVIPYEYQRFTR